MTKTNTDKLVEMPDELHQWHFEEWLDKASPGGDVEAVQRQWEASPAYRFLADQLHAFRAAIIADLCGDVEPVAHMWQHDETGLIGFVAHASAEDLAQWERINRPRHFVGKLYPASTIAALKARIAELEKDAGRYRWWRDKSPDSWRLEVGDLPLFKGDLDAAIDREIIAAIAARRKTA